MPAATATAGFRRLIEPGRRKQNSLADKLPPAEVRLALEEQRRRLEAEYAALERGRAGNEGQEVPPLARITIDNMVDIVQRQCRCVEELLAAVGEAP